MSATPITFAVPGYPSEGGSRGATGSSPATERGTLSQSVTVAARRGEGGEVRVTALPGQDVVVLHIENGPSLRLHPENARDLILAQNGFAPSRAGGATTADEAVRVPPSFRWRGIEQTVPTRGGTRSRLGDVVLKGIDVIRDAASEFAVDFIAGKAQSLAASALVRRVDDQVKEGVYRLTREALGSLKTAEALTTIPDLPDRLLVLIHGTFSTTGGTFGQLWTQHPTRVARLFEHYQDRVFALDHRTLGASPLANALTLARALPGGARVHLVTHSRGGLVGEVLARACATGNGGQDVFDREGYEQHRDDLRDLLHEVATRDIKVDRLVRVACPARGTLLASKRIDAYLSVLKWTLDLAGIPVAGALVDFINGVAQHRADPEKIPGLAAQIPDSPLVQWLHRVDRPLDGELRVVAGDVEGDSITSWLKTLLADGFYWTDNDFVVQTGSMYGGTPRRARATFSLAQGGKVSHFSYFTHATTAAAIVDALVEDEPKGFQPIGKLSYEGKDSSGTRAAVRPQADRPALILVPGVFGSHLKDARGRVWLDWDASDAIGRLRFDTAIVTPDGLVGAMYGALHDALAATHEVIAFPYDWRQPIERSCEELAERLDVALRARDASNQPVRILAHSTGGLVVRTLQLDHADVWQRWLSHPEARLLMLATPNAGLWAPMQLLSADDTLGGALTFLSAPFGEQETRQILAGFPGVMQLQAGLLDDPLLQDPKTWRTLADDDVRRVIDASSWHASDLQQRALAWGTPDDKVLERAVTLQRRLATQLATDLAPVSGKILIVTGQAPLTPGGYVVGPEGFSYIYTPAGDGCVTHDSAALPGVKTWVVDDTHDRLPSNAKVRDACVELLQTGTTARLPLATAAPTGGIAGGIARGDARGGAPGEARLPRDVVVMRPARTPKAAMPPGASAQLLGTIEQDAVTPDDPTTLRVTIVNGDLSFVKEPLMLGHYRSSKLTGTEWVMNRLIGGTMASSLGRGQYPDRASSHQVFVNTRVGPASSQLPRPEAVVVVGLGEEGKLKPAHLIATVRQGVLAWAQRLSEGPDPPSTFNLAATLMSSGGIDVSAGQSAQLIVQGVCEANQRLAEGWEETDGRDVLRPWPRVAHLSLIEIYLSRAAEAWRALKIAPGLEAHEYVLTDVIETGVGGLPRPIDSSYRGADYDFIRAESLSGELGMGIAYTLDTKRARSESRPQPVQAALIRNLVEQGADHQSRDRQIGNTLFRLLVPVEMEPFLTGDTDALIEVDSGTAGIPWELLDTSTPGSSDRRPWAIRTKLLRKLKTAEFRAQVADASLEASALVIGEPECDGTLYPRLPGAVAEADAVARTLEQGLKKENVRLLVGTSTGTGRPDARTVINTLLGGDWRIVHIAGHGELPESLAAKAARQGDAPPREGDPRGVVLSQGVYLGPREINSMRSVPELVFVNCCYLAAHPIDQLLTSDQTACVERFATARPRFASGIADALIKVGVRCVVAAGWAVDDEPAKVFAVRFYEALSRGARFIDAVAEARDAAHRQPDSNTWGAYQCYGDPDWTLRKPEHEETQTIADGLRQFDVVASAQGLVLALQTIAVRIKYQNQKPAIQREYLRWLEDRFAARWGDMGRVAEAFGDAWSEAEDRTAALGWYVRALAANDGGATLRSAEQLGNLQVRLAWRAVSGAERRYRDEKARHDREQPAEARPELADAARARDTAITDARTAIHGAIDGITKLISVKSSMERQSLLGSAYKRLAMIEAIARDGRETAEDLSAEAAALSRMQHHYQLAETLGNQHRLTGVYYPALNRIGAELALARGGCIALDAAVVDAIRQSLDAHVAEAPDFWNVVSQTELRVYQALANGRLKTELPNVIEAYDDLHRRIRDSWMWGSVAEQAEFVLARCDNADQAEQDSARRLIRHLRAFAASPP